MKNTTIFLKPGEFGMKIESFACLHVSRITEEAEVFFSKVMVHKMTSVYSCYYLFNCAIKYSSVTHLRW